MTVNIPISCQQLPTENSSEMEQNYLLAQIDSKIYFSNDNFLQKHKINLQWKNIKYVAVDGKKILNGLNGSSNSGELTVIMGPSGSGKTTLVNILSGFAQKRVSGEILVNGSKRERNAYRNLTSYILQDDYILPRFTVREIITFASKLKIPSTVSEMERQKAVDDWIHSLGLVQQQHQRANTLSGGQKKRLCIAQEILNNPPLILLDEPTSGLDSSSCIQCILLLKKMAEQGRNIICTIHQPSSRIFELFDNLYMLSDGDCIYRGPTKELLSYLDNQGLECPKYYNPTDFLTDIAIGHCGEGLTKLKEAIKSMDNANSYWFNETNVVIPDNEEKYPRMTMFGSLIEKIKDLFQECWQDIRNDGYSSSNFTQFQVLVKRSFLNQLRDPIHLNLKFFSSIIVGLLLGSMLYDKGRDGNKIFSVASLLFALLFFLVITGKFPTVLTFPLERKIFEREHRNGWYSTKMYYLATSVSQIPYQVICPILNSGLFYWLSGQPNELYRISFFMLSCIFVALISESIGLMIGAVSNPQNGTIFASLSTSAELVLSGFFLPYQYTPSYLRWLCLSNYARYALTSFLLEFYDKRPLRCKSIICLFKDPEEMLEYFDMDGDLYLNICMMLLLLCIFKISAYLSLSYKISQSK